jgi:phosphohistidine swiveling domain-containing protein
MTTAAEPMFIVPLDSPACTLSHAGAKAANLSVLLRSGLPVPAGFVVTTDAYRRFVEGAAPDAWVAETAEVAAAHDHAALEAASETIRRRFSETAVPQGIARAVAAAHREMGGAAVAVRSSATTEDLPDLSFAGQHDTILNVVGEQALADAVILCWSSLWTPRAIGYRARHGISQRGLALAVVVQKMVPSECSGVLFTANPVSGKRTEMIVEATLGLGEALVSGQVEPDRYAVAIPPRIAARVVGSKRLTLRPRPEGGIERHEDDGGATQALADERILELARIAERVAGVLPGPQDIEWAFAAGKLWLLQSRPITSLYPPPAGVPSEPLQVYLSLGAVQGMLDPFTPLGQDLIRLALVKAIGRRFGFDVEPGPAGPVAVAGERLYINATRALRNRFLRGRITAGLMLVEPRIHELLLPLLENPRLSPGSATIPLSTALRLARVAVRIPWNALLNLLRPAARRAQILARADDAVARLEAERGRVHTVAEALALLEPALEIAARVVIPYLASGIAAGLGMLGLLRWLARAAPGGEHLALEATRGLPHNVTTEMDLALWRAAREGSAQAREDFLARYGMRGVAEIDLGRPRWREDPTQIAQVIQSYLRLPPEQAPDLVFARGATAAEAALERLERELRSQPGGWWRAPLSRWAGRRMRALAGLREAPKFFLVRMVGIVREALLAVRGPDAFFLHLDELRTPAERGHADRIAERRAAYSREQRRRRVPRLLMSDGEALYGDETAPVRAGAGAEVLTGAGVSAGVIEGIARVVFDPAAQQLLPGEILVCPGTDPAWTPLFFTAGGLVMEVGGLLTHGSVVAREYGIPAVAGVHDATIRLRTGDRIRVDGFTGQVTILS